MKKTLLCSLILVNTLFAGGLRETYEEQKNIDIFDTAWDTYNAYYDQKEKMKDTEKMRIQKIENILDNKKETKSISTPPKTDAYINQLPMSKYQKELYPFTLYSTNLSYFSMQQSNEILVNSSLFLGDRVAQYTESTWAKVLWNLALTIGYELSTDVWAHEEAHRSILSYHDISSTNQWMDGEVDHVKTITLNHFKRDNYIDFIRLHTAGIESEVLAINSFNEALIFEHHDAFAVAMRLLMLKFVNYDYISSDYEGDGLHDNAEGFDELSTPEMDRDIVGHDVYGFVRHLFTKSDVAFTRRYSNIDQFTPEELAYHDRVAKRAWLNFLDTNLLRWVYEDIDIYGFETAFGFNYYLAPFGDVTDFNIYASSKNSKNSLTISQMRNHHSNFYGLAFKDYRRKVGDFWLTSRLNIWQNPKEFDFFTDKSFIGGSAEVNVEYEINQYFNISAGLLTKTKGFLLGVNDDNLKSMTALSLGVVLKY